MLALVFVLGVAVFVLGVARIAQAALLSGVGVHSPTNQEVPQVTHERRDWAHSGKGSTATVNRMPDPRCHSGRRSHSSTRIPVTAAQGIQRSASPRRVTTRYWSPETSARAAIPRDQISTRRAAAARKRPAVTQATLARAGRDAARL